MNGSHADRVRQVADQLAARSRGSKITIRKATPSHSIRDASYKAACHPVDVSGLCNILRIDAEARCATVEGQVLIGDLSKATLTHGLVPAVVPEFRKFTIAGLINGEGIQSSSHRHGLFTHTVQSMEVLLASGETIEVSTSAHGDLFAALPESLGTLGIITAAAIELVPARPYVEITYRRFTSLPAYLDAFRESLGQTAFHEGVIFGPRMYVLITGAFVDHPGAHRLVTEESGAPYFYQRARSAAQSGAVTHDVMHTLSYLSRFERGMWWLMECHADFPLLSETWWGRRHMDKVAAATYDRSGLASIDLTTLERDRCLVTQDIGVTLARLGDGVEWVQQHLGVYPIWNCAVRLRENTRNAAGTSYLVDIGVYGEPMIDGYRHIRDMRALQRLADAPSLWGVSYLTWEEIRSANPARYAQYEQVRRIYGADHAFMHLKDKVVWVDADQPDRGKIPFWRLYRSFGRRWYLNPAVYPLYVVAQASKLVWRPRA
jgi:FAD/FMN-containing dehydrogenase